MQKYSELPLTERPHEKLKLFGAASLSNAELISIVSDMDDIAAVHALLSETQNGIADLASLGADSMDRAGFGAEQATKLWATAELGERIKTVEEISQSPEIGRPEDLLPYLSGIMQEKQEHAAVISLNIKNKVTGTDIVSKGNISSAIVDTCDVFRPAIKNGAVSIVLAHNHPSGDASPSTPDFYLTEKLIDAGRIMNIKLVDHLIITKDKQCFSFLRNHPGIFKEEDVDSEDSHCASEHAAGGISAPYVPAATAKHIERVAAPEEQEIGY